jgi:hypothetical protein
MRSQIVGYDGTLNLAERCGTRLGLVTSTQPSRQKNRVAIKAVKTKNQKNARKNCGKSAARAHPSFCTDGPTGFINTLL